MQFSWLDDIYRQLGMICDLALIWLGNINEQLTKRTIHAHYMYILWRRSAVGYKVKRAEKSFSGANSKLIAGLRTIYLRQVSLISCKKKACQYCWQSKWLEINTGELSSSHLEESCLWTHSCSLLRRVLTAVNTNSGQCIRNLLTLLSFLSSCSKSFKLSSTVCPAHEITLFLYDRTNIGNKY